MANEQKKQNKPSYEELEQYCVQLQNQLREQNRVSEFRDMVAVCLELLKYKDALPEHTFKKVVDFIDKVVPVPKEQEGAAPEK
jgi:hypothetical protein